MWNWPPEPIHGIPGGLAARDSALTSAFFMAFSMEGVSARSKPLGDSVCSGASASCATLDCARWVLPGVLFELNLLLKECSVPLAGELPPNSPVLESLCLEKELPAAGETAVLWTIGVRPVVPSALPLFKPLQLLSAVCSSPSQLLCRPSGPSPLQRELDDTCTRTYLLVVCQRLPTSL